MRVVKHTILLMLLLVTVACGSTGRSVEVHDVDSEAWYAVEEYKFNNEDSLSLRDISIVLRYNKGYVADSLPLSVLTISPDSLLFEEHFTLHIPRLADMRPEEHTFLYRRDVKLQRKGSYTFRLTPLTPTKGIASVGIVVSDK